MVDFVYDIKYYPVKSPLIFEDKIPYLQSPYLTWHFNSE